jgi:hypothetical protein
MGAPLFPSSRSARPEPVAAFGDGADTLWDGRKAAGFGSGAAGRAILASIERNTQLFPVFGQRPGEMRRSIRSFELVGVRTSGSLKKQVQRNRLSPNNLVTTSARGQRGHEASAPCVSAEGNRDKSPRKVASILQGAEPGCLARRIPRNTPTDQM